MWHEVRIRREVMSERGVHCKVTQAFLVEADTFTEAEARIIEQERATAIGDIEVVAIKRTNISEVFFSPVCSEDSKWYMFKVGFIIIDERTAKEKYRYDHMLVEAENINEARNQFAEVMKSTISDYKVLSLSETTLSGVYKY